MRKGLSFIDLLAIIACWAGAIIAICLTKDGFIAIICIAAEYYLAKWIILRHRSEPEDPER